MILRTLILTLLITAMGCKGQKTMKKQKHTNDLIHETSPYLLQHAHNPVNWKAWNNKTLNLAKKENKPLLISIGYSSCHWCHVMEQESFENDSVAKIMNENFICIKVDREERPDVDQVYMDAIQLIAGRGGWPLNAIALPDGKPFYGGTYYSKENWIGILTDIAKLWKEEPEKVKEYAHDLERGLIEKNTFLPVKTSNEKLSLDIFKDTKQTWDVYLDHSMGGYNRAPKFPMPNNYQYLLRYAVQSEDMNLLNYVNTTLTKMAYGGIYDHIGGGFSRYSTDTKWHIPHFEKMLYDNAQLVSLYADAYLVTKKPLYKEVVYQTLEFIQRELTDQTGSFYASLDADSQNENGEREEGSFYTWKKEELKMLLGEDYPVFKSYYNINKYGLWEKDNYVLIRDKSPSYIAKEYGFEVSELEKKKTTWQNKLLQARNKRAHPSLDDKAITSWNALMLKAYVDAYRVFDEENFLRIAEKNARFILTKQIDEQGRLSRNYKAGKTTINAYIEDYATLTEALICLYEVTFDETYLQTAYKLTTYATAHFFDPKSGLYFFSSDEDPALISRKIDIDDNVIPSGNSIMATNLFKLSHYFDKPDFFNKSNHMLKAILSKAKAYPPGYSNWLQLGLDRAGSYYEIALTGDNSIEKLKELNQYYIPNKLIAGSKSESNNPLLKNRFQNNETWIYICVDKTCQLPTSDVKTAIQQITTTINTKK